MRIRTVNKRKLRRFQRRPEVFIIAAGKIEKSTQYPLTGRFLHIEMEIDYEAIFGIDT